MNVQDLAQKAQATFKNTSNGELKGFKEEHLKQFKLHGLNLDPEFYKFTPMSSFFETLQSMEGPLVQSDDSFLPTLLLKDGELVSSPKTLNFSVKKISECFKEIESYLSVKGPLSDLHHASMTEGLLIDVPKNGDAGVLRILHLTTDNGTVAPAVIVRLGQNAKLSLIEETMIQGGTHLSESYVELAPGSALEHIHLDHVGVEAINHGQTRAHVHKDATYSNFIFTLSGKLTRRNLELNLLAPGANGESYNLFLASEKEHTDINTVINHKAPDTTSNQIAKGILDGDSKCVFTGKIHIHPQAQRVVSGQLNKNLLLSKKAQIHSQPQLEIFADDVKCSHGSTTGQMSDEEVFYFEARGIPKEKARTLLAHGFGLEIVLKIKDKELKEKVGAAVLTTLKTKFKIGGAQ